MNHDQNTPCLNKDLKECNGQSDPGKKAATKLFIEKVRNNCSAQFFQNYFLSLFPIIQVIKKYKFREYLKGDIVSGISVACLHFPHAIALGILASVTPANGLYTVLFPGLAYVFFGTSQHVSMGTTAILCIFTAELVEYKSESFLSQYNNNLNDSFNETNSTATNSRLNDNLLAYKVSVAAGSSFLVGIFLLLMGIFKLGFITSYLSSSFIAGFTTAGGMHIISVNLPTLLGIQSKTVNGPGKLIYKYIDIIEKIQDINFATLLLSLLCLFMLIFIKDFINERYKHKLKIPIPIDVILVIGVTIVSKFAKFHENFNIDIVGDIPTGLPTPTLPEVSVDMVGNSVIVAMMCFILTISLTRLCEKKHNYSVDDNQELFAYGASNFLGSFFSCIPCAVGPPRTIILSKMGSKTTLNGIVAALVAFLVIMFIGPYLRWAPNAFLATMIVALAKNLLVQVKILPKLWRINRFDFVIFLGTLLSGVLIDFPYSLYVGLLLSLFTIIVQSQTAAVYAFTFPKANLRSCSLSKGDSDLSRKTPLIATFKMECSLYFATAERFKRELYKQTINPSSFKKNLEDWIINARNKTDQTNETEADILDRGEEESTVCTDKIMHGFDDGVTVPFTYIIIDCSSMNYIDMNGSRLLCDIRSEFHFIGVTLVLAGCTRFMSNFIAKSELSKKFDPTHVYKDMSDAYLELSKNSP